MEKESKFKPTPLSKEEESAELTEALAEFPATDLERARLFANDLDGNARYVPEWKSWFMWTGEQWQQDISEIYERIFVMVDELKAEANENPDLKLRKALVKQAMTAGSSNSINAVLHLCGNMRDIRATPEFFDSDPMIIGARNGIIDLRTGEFRPERKEDFILKKLGTDYDPAAKCPQWDAFLTQILPHPELVAFVQRAIGYSLTGLTREQVMFFLYGGGQNGKSTFINVIQKLVGGYGWRTSAALFLASKHGDDASLNMLSALPEKRFVVGAEVEQGARMAEARIKDLTGGDKINARQLFCEAFNFDPTHKLWLYGNYKPTIRGTDEGIWRRMCMVPFEVSVPKAQQDFKLPDKLETELPGILNWALRGCAMWQEGGLQVPQLVKDAVQEYREEEDTIGEFIREECRVGPDKPTGTCTVMRNKLYKAYGLWCEEEGYNYPHGPKAFATRVRKTGAREDGNTSSTRRSWRGIALKDPASFVTK